LSSLKRAENDIRKRGLKEPEAPEVGVLKHGNPESNGQLQQGRVKLKSPENHVTTRQHYHAPGAGRSSVQNFQQLSFATHYSGHSEQINKRQTKEILAKNLTFDTQPLQSSRNPVSIGSSSTYDLLREVLPLFTIDVVLQDRTHSSLG
jgi:hypothetical protein